MPATPTPHCAHLDAPFLHPDPPGGPLPLSTAPRRSARPLGEDQSTAGHHPSSPWPGALSPLEDLQGPLTAWHCGPRASRTAGGAAPARHLELIPPPAQTPPWEPPGPRVAEAETTPCQEEGTEVAGPLLSPKVSVGASARWGFWRRKRGGASPGTGMEPCAETLTVGLRHLKTHRGFSAGGGHSGQREGPSKGGRCLDKTAGHWGRKGSCRHGWGGYPGHQR